MAPRPEFSVLLTARPCALPWEVRWVAWPDFLLPLDRAAAVAALDEAFGRASSQRVEITCGGGRGRTGTALALLARMAGVPAADAVAWVRAEYRPDAIETLWQRRFAERAPLSD